MKALVLERSCTRSDRVSAECPGSSLSAREGRRPEKEQEREAEEEEEEIEEGEEDDLSFSFHKGASMRGGAWGGGWTRPCRTLELVPALRSLQLKRKEKKVCDAPPLVHSVQTVARAASVWLAKFHGIRAVIPPPTHTHPTPPQTNLQTADSEHFNFDPSRRRGASPASAARADSFCFPLQRRLNADK